MIRKLDNTPSLTRGTLQAFLVTSWLKFKVALWTKREVTDNVLYWWKLSTIITIGETLGGITKEDITRWFHKLKKNLYIINSIYFALLVHRQEYRNELFFFLYTNPILVCETTLWYASSLFQQVSPSPIAMISTIHQVLSLNKT
jgi:hypothetical protein